MRNRLRGGNKSMPIATSATSSTDLKRRSFLLSLSAGGAGVAAVAMATPGIAAPESDVAVTDGDNAEYRETEHVRDYYRTTRL